MHIGTALLGLRSGGPISPADVLEALENRGPLEAFCIKPLFGRYSWTLVCTVTFAYVDDCKDAIRVRHIGYGFRRRSDTADVQQHFVNDTKYYMMLLPVDGSPLLPWVTVFPTTPFSSNFNDTELITTSISVGAAIKKSPDQEVRKGSIESKFKPKTGRTIEEYVRGMARELNINLSEDALLDVIQELEEVWEDRMCGKR